ESRPTCGSILGFTVGWSRAIGGDIGSVSILWRDRPRADEVRGAGRSVPDIRIDTKGRSSVSTPCSSNPPTPELITAQQFTSLANFSLGEAGSRHATLPSLTSVSSRMGYPSTSRSHRGKDALMELEGFCPIQLSNLACNTLKKPSKIKPMYA